MARPGRRHCLILYTFTLNRWWKFTLGIGAVLLALAVGLEISPVRFSQSQYTWIPEKTLWVIAGAGIYAILLSVFLITIRKSAYVQPFPTHLRLITPFLRMNISYRRILQASSVEMQHLFPIYQYKGWKKKLLRPLASQTAIVLEMRGWPIPRWVLGYFLSPFFFPDKTSRLALLVPKWMEFSMDMESFRSTWYDSQNQPKTTPQSALLASISKSKK